MSDILRIAYSQINLLQLMLHCEESEVRPLLRKILAKAGRVNSGSKSDNQIHVFA